VPFTSALEARCLSTFAANVASTASRLAHRLPTVRTRTPLQVLVRAHNYIFLHRLINPLHFSLAKFLDVVIAELLFAFSLHAWDIEHAALGDTGLQVVTNAIFAKLVSASEREEV
jgi:hypothetical protein